MTIEKTTARNRTLPCRLQGCAGMRAPLSPFCIRHAKRVERYGHPSGRAIRPTEYRGERETAERFLSKHAAHPGIEAAERFLSAWLEQAARGDAVPGQRDIARLAAQGITPRAILREAVAVYLFARARPSVLPDDARLTFCLGSRVCLLAPLERRFGMLKGKGRHYSRGIPKTTRREVGERLRQAFAPLFVNVEQALAEENARRQAFASSIRTPFNQPKD